MRKEGFTLEGPRLQRFGSLPELRLPLRMIDILCPACTQPLQRAPRTWQCAQRHSFDVARAGYVNLLLVQYKHSLDPGDRSDSLQARRAFLDAGHFAPLRRAVVEQLRAHAPQSVLDIGCGEGYYTAAMGAATGATATGAAPEVIGLDIAKPAIQLAAKRYREVATWLIASGAQLPFADASLDAITCLFTQLHVRELQRVLKPGGLLLVVTPAADHLQQLREGLFETVQPHEPDKLVETLGTGFALHSTQILNFDLLLNHADVSNLLCMTPYAWKARPERREAMARRTALQTAAAFAILEFERTA